MSSCSKFVCNDMTPTEEVLIVWERRVGGLKEHEFNMMRKLIISKEGGGATVAGALKCMTKSHMFRIFATVKLEDGADWMLRNILTNDVAPTIEWPVPVADRLPGDPKKKNKRGGKRPLLGSEEMCMRRLTKADLLTPHVIDSLRYPSLNVSHTTEKAIMRQLVIDGEEVVGDLYWTPEENCWMSSALNVRYGEITDSGYGINDRTWETYAWTSIKRARCNLAEWGCTGLAWSPDGVTEEDTEPAAKNARAL